MMALEDEVAEEGGLNEDGTTAGEDVQVKGSDESASI
ncbi:hypothetical protein L195_g057974 [Trifolium pratense]|uniref:Uncharacterized protein n=1 Tax=Trifolium pratense TaxID=57577 RepID=A0A2K3KXK8_TRIPR|nr:hypothetical protein L195_g057974 [Trifolium pratense]